ncbi:MAG: hypothetical protein BBJ57_04890 [Desulfobacterales bacterium PC51MH44]|nr:MAG: hypothetical protein BBJ57_04890 [Desulfobacterales bacterium PC51MH44]
MNLTKKKSSKDIISLPFPVYFWTVAFLTTAGLADSIYLAISHYRVYTDVAYSSFCAISKAINCDTVSQTSYSIFLNVPVPVWGIVGHTFFLLFLPFAWKKEADKKRIWPILFFISSIFSIYSVILAVISAYYIHSYCIMCILSFGLSFFLLYYTWLISKRFGRFDILHGLRLDIDYLWKFRKKTLPVFIPFLSFVLVLFIAFPVYWNLAPPLLSKEMLHGITKDGHPWIGARNPELEITEFTDYQCFQCKKMHFFLRQLIEEHPDKIRLIHRHFPMDHNFNPIVKQPFYIGSGQMALLAIYASSKDKFWQMNDVLFEINRESKTINIKELAEAVGLNPVELGHSVNNKMLRSKLQRDILSGLKLRISGTPAYVIDKEVYLGLIPPEIIKSALKR